MQMRLVSSSSESFGTFKMSFTLQSAGTDEEIQLTESSCFAVSNAQSCVRSYKPV